ncbi:BlaI/MecI/CopY family transcriptional regulator [Nocardiopsis composta]|nr:BlaI/MecI/CopY family transcriptional regulator [Nocardiopsis composta]
MEETGPGLGPLEAAVLDVLWDAGEEVSVRRVVDALPGRTPAYTTISTVLENLRRKGWVDRRRTGRVWFYRPLRDRASYAARRMHGALTDSGDSRAALLRFVDEMSPEEVDVLRSLLADVPREADS